MLAKTRAGILALGSHEKFREVIEQEMIVIIRQISKEEKSLEQV